jgi:hypothetical protein
VEEISPSISSRKELRNTGNDARGNNIMAARSSPGRKDEPRPWGMDKMLVDSFGDVTI